jgi:hypothetical protein
MGQQKSAYLYDNAKHVGYNQTIALLLSLITMFLYTFFSFRWRGFAVRGRFHHDLTSSITWCNFDLIEKQDIRVSITRKNLILRFIFTVDQRCKITKKLVQQWQNSWIIFTTPRTTWSSYSLTCLSISKMDLYRYNRDK